MASEWYLDVFCDFFSCLRYMCSTIIMAMKQKCLGLFKVLGLIHFCEVIVQRADYKDDKEYILLSLTSFPVLKNVDKILSILLCDGSTVT